MVGGCDISPTLVDGSRLNSARAFVLTEVSVASKESEENNLHSLHRFRHSGSSRLFTIASKIKRFTNKTEEPSFKKKSDVHPKRKMKTPDL